MPQKEVGAILQGINMNFEQLLKNLRKQPCEIKQHRTIEYSNQVLHTVQMKDGVILDLVEFPKNHYTLEKETVH